MTIMHDGLQEIIASHGQRISRQKVWSRKGSKTPWAQEQILGSMMQQGKDLRSHFSPSTNILWAQFFCW